MDQETAYLNQVIRGLIHFRKCPNCDASGIELVSYNGGGEPCHSEDEEAQRFDCCDCHGLAFIEIPS